MGRSYICIVKIFNIKEIYLKVLVGYNENNFKIQKGAKKPIWGKETLKFNCLDEDQI